MPLYSIQKIERVQNPALWEIYQWCVQGSLLVGWSLVPSDSCFPDMPVWQR